MPYVMGLVIAREIGTQIDVVVHERHLDGRLTPVSHEQRLFGFVITSGARTMKHLERLQLASEMPGQGQSHQRDKRL